jgi:hypothetical protein
LPTLAIPRTLRRIAQLPEDPDDADGLLKASALESAAQSLAANLDPRVYDYISTHADCVGHTRHARAIRAIALLAGDDVDKADFGLAGLEVIYAGQAGGIPAPQSEPGPPPAPGVWPLGINPDMDRHVANAGLPHWSCADPRTNTHWVRKDGRRCSPTFAGLGGYPDDLRRVDREHPMAADSQPPSEESP